MMWIANLDSEHRLNNLLVWAIIELVTCPYLYKALVDEVDLSCQESWQTDLLLLTYNSIKVFGGKLYI